MGVNLFHDPWPVCHLVSISRKKGVGFVGKETGELAVIDTPFSEGRYGFLRDGLTTFKP